LLVIERAFLSGAVTSIAIAPMPSTAQFREFDQGQFGAIALPGTQLEYPRVSARAILEAGADLVEQFLQYIAIRNVPPGLATRVQVALLRQRDQSLRHRPELARLRLRRPYALM
jgi:hypothetical protein